MIQSDIKGGFIKATGVAIALGLIVSPLAAFAQQTQWFVPGQTRPAAAPPPSRPAPRPAPMPAGPPGVLPLPGEAEQAGAGGPPAQFQLPPAPEIPPMPKGQATPAAIVGILSVPDVLRVSTAYQAAYKELNARGQKLNEDAQKEQGALRDLGQAFAAERSKLSPEQIRSKEKEIQDRATEAQRRFGERNRIIQEAGQYVMLQINRTMEQAAQQVALSRGINLVLNRAQILGTTADFDLTPAVAEVLNKALPSVIVPPDGVSPLAMATQAAPAGQATPAAASTAAAKPAQKH
ncbi:OmpH family outer membrane protein [Rhodopila sp.]|uniref:OmpH family outer membrane protein n=1 Tax=Rhodopila sp. TaxID=2480087 RepID=UPI003D112537